MVTDDWRYRMLTPPKGNADYMPVNAEARKVMDAWDPAKDEASGEACRAYGAAGIMRLPGRLHITWENDNTLKMDLDAGTQTRRFVFGDAPPAGEPSWQGSSSARWMFPPVGRGGRGERPQTGQLVVTTTRMRPGYLRKNGIPLQRECHVNREYFVRLVDERSGVSGGDDDGGRSAVSGAAVHQDLRVQETARRDRLESHALLGEVALRF